MTNDHAQRQAVWYLVPYTSIYGDAYYREFKNTSNLSWYFKTVELPSTASNVNIPPLYSYITKAITPNRNYE